MVKVDGGSRSKKEFPSNSFSFPIFLLGLLFRLLEKALLLGKGLGLGVDRGPLLLDHLAALADVLMGQFRGLGNLGVDHGLVVEVEARSGKEEDQDQREQRRGREPGAQGPDDVGETNELKREKKKKKVARVLARVQLGIRVAQKLLFFLCSVSDISDHRRAMG